MIKSELIAVLAEKITYLPEKKIADSVNCLIALMRSALTDGERIEVRGFGSFVLRHHAARNAHNPKTGEKVITKSKQTPHFKPGKGLRERVNDSRLTQPIQED